VTVLDAFDRFVGLVARLTRIVLLLLVAVLFLIVIFTVGSRYIFNYVLSWSEEVPRYLLVWISLLGASLAVYHQEHIGFDYVYARLPERVRIPLRVLLNLGVAAMGVIMLVYGITFTRDFGGDTMESLPYTNIWYYISMPISGALITLFVLNQEARVLDAALHRRKVQERAPEHTVSL
jgi:TRAP-type transport system small permease protein